MLGRKKESAEGLKCKSLAILLTYPLWFLLGHKGFDFIFSRKNINTSLSIILGNYDDKRRI
jgi:hypothetical protein